MLYPRVNDGRPPDAYSPDMETMADRIRVLRQARGMSQQELAKLTGVTMAAVSHWEKGVTQNIKLATFLVLVDVLQTDVDFLVHGAARGRIGAMSARRSDRMG